MPKQKNSSKGKLKAPINPPSDSDSCKPANLRRTLPEAPASASLAVITGLIPPVPRIPASTKDTPKTATMRNATSSECARSMKSSTSLEDSSQCPSLAENSLHPSVSISLLTTGGVSPSQSSASLGGISQPSAAPPSDGSNLLQPLKNVSRASEDHRPVAVSGSQEPRTSSSHKRSPIGHKSVLLCHLGIGNPRSEAARKLNEAGSASETKRNRTIISEEVSRTHSADMTPQAPTSAPGRARLANTMERCHRRNNDQNTQPNGRSQPNPVKVSTMQAATSAEVPVGLSVQLAEKIETLARELSNGAVEVQLPITPPLSPPPIMHAVQTLVTEPTNPAWTPRGSLDRLVLDSTNVRFGDGLAVEMVTTPFEPTGIIVSGISPRLLWEDLRWYLEDFGKVVHHDLKNEGPESHGQMAHIRFSHHQEAANAIRALDGHPGIATDIPLLATYDTAVAPNLTSTNIVADGVIIRWHTPRPKLRLYYKSKRVAREEVDIINQRTFCGHHLRATLRASQHVVIVEGLSSDSDLNEIKRRHCPDREPVFLENYYEHSSIMEQMNNLFKQAHLRHLEIKETEEEVIIYSNFHSQNDAENFLKTFGELDLPWRGPARLCVIHTWNLVYVMNVDKYLALQASIDDLAAKLQQVEIRLRVFTPPGHLNFRHICVRGGQHVKAYKSMIDAILMGEVVTRGGKPLWDTDLEYLYGPRLFSDLRIEGSHVFMDLPRQRIMLLGADDQRAMATRRIFTRFDEAKRRLCTHIFQRWQLRYFVEAIENTLVPRFGRHDVLLDTRACRITVGGLVAGRFLKDIASKAPQLSAHSHDYEQTGGRCPVCLDIPSDPIRLACEHQFCKACLTRYLLSATRPDADFPMRCFGDEGHCASAVPLNVTRRLLDRDQFDLATRHSLKRFVDSRPQEYRHCSTSNCPQVFRIRPRTECTESAEHCPGCLNKFCQSCFLEGGHDGITCARALENQQLALEEEAQIIEGWVRDLGGRACPRCKMGLIKDGGCAHVQCSKCKVHICWTCGKTFDQVADESVYEHMRREHGSIGLIDWELDDWNANNVAAWWEPVVPPQSSGSSAGSPVAAKPRRDAKRGAPANKNRRHGPERRRKKNRKPQTRRFSQYTDDELSEDEDDDFGGGQWDYDFADVNWESI